MWFRSIWEPAKTDEEFADVLRKRRNFIPVMAMAGAAAIAASTFLLRSEERAFLAGLYMGLGCSLLAVCVVWFLKIRSILKDEKKIRMRRLKEADERNIQVTMKAHYTAGALLIAVGYAVLLVAGFFSMEVFWTVWTFVMLYFVLFVIGRVFYERKM